MLYVSFNNNNLILISCIHISNKVTKGGEGKWFESGVVTELDFKACFTS